MSRKGYHQISVFPHSLSEQNLHWKTDANYIIAESNLRRALINLEDKLNLQGNLAVRWIPEDDKRYEEIHIFLPTKDKDANKIVFKTLVDEMANLGLISATAAVELYKHFELTPTNAPDARTDSIAHAK